MAESFNPYAAPLVDITPIVSVEEGVWCDQGVLRMTKKAKLPDRCLKCNSPEVSRRLVRNLTWHPQWWYVLLLVNLLLYIVVAAIGQKKAKVAIPICAVHLRRRRWAIAVGWLGFLLAVFLFVVGVSMGGGPAAPQAAAVALMITAGVVLLGALVYGVTASKVAEPKKIDKDFVWLKKVHPDYLAMLPDWALAARR